MSLRRLFLIILITAPPFYSQFKIDYDYNLVTIADSNYLIFNIYIRNVKEYDQVLFLQNWRIAYAGNDKIVGFPYMSNLLNHLFLVPNDSDFLRFFLGEEESQALFKNCFKILRPRDQFRINIIVKDSAFIKIFNTGKYELHYLNSYAIYSKLKKILPSSLANEFINDKSITMIFNDRITSEILLYNIYCKTEKEDLNKELDLETTFKINDVFRKYEIIIKPRFEFWKE